MNDLQSRIVSITRKMRATAYHCGSIQMEEDTIPFGGSIKESIGPFPEFILKGHFCLRSAKGFCTPCFYSRLPIHNICDHQFDNGYSAQVRYIVNHFDEVIIKNQIGRVAYPTADNQCVYGIVCTPTGSYFDASEYPIEVRKKNLKVLINAMNQHKCKIALHIESHAEDVIHYFENPDFEEISLLHALNTRVLLGFESVNEFPRNVLYAKRLSLNDFEYAVSVLKEQRFPVGAFVFAGLFAFTDQETISDVSDSLQYLKKKCVSPVLMFANTQKYTIPDVLLENGKYKLLDPWTVATIVKKTINLFGCNMASDIDPWFIADPKGGPPDPNLHIFNANTSTACPHCANTIYNAIEELRITKDKSKFYAALDSINHCSCKVKYNELLQDQVILAQQHSAHERADYLSQYANSVFDYYVLKDNPWIVKAELLCYGLHITDDQKNTIASINPFINEKGFINATHVVFKDTLINVCVAESFCERSPFSIQQIGGANHWLLLKNGFPLGPLSFLDFPAWVYQSYKGEIIGRIARPHSDKCISLWPSLDCSYVQAGNGCRYCGLNTLPKEEMIQFQPDYLTEIVHTAMQYNPNYEVNLSGGTCCSPDHAIDYLSSICSALVRKCGNIIISVECAPPEDPRSLYRLKNAGASAIVMNLEIFSETLREKVCPGKGSISNNRYFCAFIEAIKLFGAGNVSSVLIVGIQPKQDILTACECLIQIGVIPTLIPFKPLDGTPMQDEKTPDSSEYIEISRKVAVMLKQHNLSITRTSGCASCGACSLEVNLEGIVI